MIKYLLGRYFTSAMQNECILVKKMKKRNEMVAFESIHAKYFIEEKSFQNFSEYNRN